MEDFTGGSYRAAKSFRNQRGISQLRGIFVANGKKMETFSQPISQLRNEGGGLRNGTSVLRGGFAATKPPAKWGCGCENVIFQAWGISQSISQLRKFLQKGCMGLRNHLQTMKWPPGCEIDLWNGGGGGGLRKHLAKPREVAKMPIEPRYHASEEEGPAHPEITHTKPLTPFLTSLNHQSP